MNRAAEPYRKVVEIVNGFQDARIVHLAVGLDVFTRLADEGKTAAQMAAFVHADPHAMDLLLNALADLGLLHKDHERFSATAVSQTYLARGGPRYLGHLVTYQSRRWNEWAQLEEVVRNGVKPAPGGDPPADLEALVLGRHELAVARGDLRHLARALPLRNCRTLLDLGGSPGTLAALCCRAFPQLHAVVVDLPATVAITRRVLGSWDVAHQVTARGADFQHEAIPGGPYDVGVVHHPMHDGPSGLEALLGQVREALSPGGLVVVRPHATGEPDGGAATALGMLLGGRGRAHSVAEIEAGLRSVGFGDVTHLEAESSAHPAALLALGPGPRTLVSLAGLRARIGSEPAPAATMLRRDSDDGEWSDEGSARRPAPRLAPLRPRSKSGTKRAKTRAATTRRGRATGRKPGTRSTRSR